MQPPNDYETKHPQLCQSTSHDVFVVKIKMSPLSLWRVISSTRYRKPDRPCRISPLGGGESHGVEQRPFLPSCIATRTPLRAAKGTGSPASNLIALDTLKGQLCQHVLVSVLTCYTSSWMAVTLGLMGLLDVI